MSPRPRVRLVQALCPQRHCVLAVAYEAPRTPEPVILKESPHIDKLRTVLQATIGAGFMHAHCAICHAGAEQFTYEDAPTAYSTLREAQPHLQREEVRQQAARMAAAHHRASNN